MDTFLDHRIAYLYFIRTVVHFSCVMFNFGLINVHLFDILPAISSRKVREMLGIVISLDSGEW